MGKILSILYFTLFSVPQNNLSCDSLKYKVNVSEISRLDPWFSKDKFMHFSISASVVGLSYHTLVCRLNKNKYEGEIISLSFTALIGIGKEIYDKKRKKHFSLKDLCWDGIGILTGFFAFIYEY